MSEHAERLPSSSGARLAGDDYQHAITWLEMLRMLMEDEVERVDLEMGQAEAGIVDDLCVHTADGLSRYTQVKYAVDQSKPLDSAWFTTLASSTKSPLQRFYDSFEKLSERGSALLELRTARSIDPADPILRHVDNEDGRLVRRLWANSNAQEQRAAWAKHLGITDAQLRDFLDRLYFRFSQGTRADLLERARDRMENVGLRGDENSLLLGISTVRELVRTGQQEVSKQDLRDLIKKRGLERVEPRGSLLVQELRHEPWPEMASVALDWVNRFEGDEPRDRRRPKDEADWESHIRPCIAEAAADLRALGTTNVLIQGAFRLPTAFAIGIELSQTAGFRIARRGRDGEWRSDETSEIKLRCKKVHLATDGAEIGLVVSVTADASAEVRKDIEMAGRPIAHLVCCSPAADAGQTVLSERGQTTSLAHQVLETARAQSAAGASLIHLFLACPGETALAIGHVWNRLPPTIVYADLGSAGYSPAFTYPAT